MDEIPKPDWWDRFWAKVAQDGDCKVWIGSRCVPFGHGEFKLNGKVRKAHRVIYEFHHGPIPKGLCVCHHCDRPWCVEISHLFLGSQKENIEDAASKKRMQWGERHYRASLTEEDVHKIRSTAGTDRAVGEMFNVAHGQVNRIRSGKAWRNLDVRRS